MGKNPASTWNDEKERIELNVQRHNNNMSDDKADNFRWLVFWMSLHKQYKTTRNQFNENDDDTDLLSVLNKDPADGKATMIKLWFGSFLRYR